jgi:hypothetical protein
MADEFEEVVELAPEVVELAPTDVVEEAQLPAIVEAQVVEPPAVVEPRTVEPPSDSALVPVVQAVAAAATGFVAGAAALALVKRHSARRLARVQRRALTAWQPPGEWRTRTYLVHVHVLGRPAE